MSRADNSSLGIHSYVVMSKWKVRASFNSINFQKYVSSSYPLIHSLLTFYPDYCNFLLVGLALQRLSLILRSVINAAASFIHLTIRSVFGVPLCQSFHWLLIAQQIKFRTLTTQAIHKSAPSYITNLISKYHPNCPLYSSQDLLLSCSHITSSHAHLQIFSRASFILWNFLPQTCMALCAFRLFLNAHLFREAYPPHQTEILISKTTHSHTAAIFGITCLYFLIVSSQKQGLPNPLVLNCIITTPYIVKCCANRWHYTNPV